MSTAKRTWFTSSYSGSEGDRRVEVAVTEQVIHVRDSTDLARLDFFVGRAGRTQFVRYAARG